MASAAGASPASPITASSPPMSTTSSSCATIFVRTPAAGDGISVSTLSVETSSNGSSTSTVSPSCLSHRVTVPSVTDSPGLASGRRRPFLLTPRRLCSGLLSFVDLWSKTIVLEKHGSGGVVRRFRGASLRRCAALRTRRAAPPPILSLMPWRVVRGACHVNFLVAAVTGWQNRTDRCGVVREAPGGEFTWGCSTDSRAGVGRVRGRGSSPTRVTWRTGRLRTAASRPTSNRDHGDRVDRRARRVRRRMDAAQGRRRAGAPANSART